MTCALVLHDLGDPDGGSAWRAATAEVPGCAGWLVPDLPGHASTPAPRNGAYDPMAVVTIARRALADGSSEDGLVLGVGHNAHAALVLAASGGCGRVVVVDGLHGPFFAAAEDGIASFYATLRAVADDPAATGPPPATGLDPRTTFGYGISVSAPFLQRFWEVVTVPVLAIETPASDTPPDERAERVRWFGGPAELVELDAPPPRRDHRRGGGLGPALSTRAQFAALAGRAMPRIRCGPCDRPARAGR